MAGRLCPHAGTRLSGATPALSSLALADSSEGLGTTGHGHFALWDMGFLVDRVGVAPWGPSGKI